MAIKVEKCGCILVGSITDNHNVNQNFCKLFSKSCASQKFKAIHPLDVKRVWFLLFDPVHLLKCIRNNWITEKCTKITIDGVTYGFFDDGRAVNNSAKDNILKTTPLTCASV